MKNIIALLTLIVAFCVTSGLAAADGTPAADRTFGDWVLHCAKLSGGQEACALHQKIMARDTRLPVASIALARHDQSHELRLAAVLPLGLDIPAGVAGKAGSTPLLLSVQTCVRRGCIASTTVSDSLLETLRGAESLSITFKMRGVGEATTIPVSLKGLDEGLKALDMPRN